jgi:hypothetical protein
MDEILDMIRAERKRQDGKWGEQNHSPEYWIAILGEEFGEVCTEVLGRNSLDVFLKLLQTAAVSVAWMECLLRNDQTVSTAMVRRLMILHETEE